MYLKMTALIILLSVSSAFSQAIIKVNGSERSWAFQGQVIEVQLRSSSRSRLQLEFDSSADRIDCAKVGVNLWLWSCAIPNEISPGSYFMRLFEDGINRTPDIEFNIIEKSRVSIVYPFDRTIFGINKDPRSMQVLYLDENDNLLLPVNSRDEILNEYRVLAMKYRSLGLKDREKYRHIIRENTERFNNLGYSFYDRFIGPEILIDDKEISRIKSNFSSLFDKSLFYIMEIKNGRVDVNFKKPSLIIADSNIDAKQAVESNESLEKKYKKYNSIRGIYPINFDEGSSKVNFEDIPVACHKPLAEFSIDALQLGFYSVENSVLNDAQPSPTSEPFTGGANDDTYQFTDVEYIMKNRKEIISKLDGLMQVNMITNTGKESVDIFSLDTSRIDRVGQVESFMKTVEFKGRKYNIAAHGSMISDLIKSYGGGGKVNVYQRQVCNSEDCSLARTAQGICEAILRRMSAGSHVIVNLSMSYVNRSAYMDSLFSGAVNRGVWFVVANGNADRFKNNQISENASGFVGRRQFPAYDSIRYSKMIGVGGVLLQSNGKIVNFFDNSITAVPYDYEAQIYSPAMYLGNMPWEIPHLGTSYAVPYVTAALANLLSKLDRTCEPSTLKVLNYISTLREVDDSAVGGSGQSKVKYIQLVDFSNKILSGSDIGMLCK